MKNKVSKIEKLRAAGLQVKEKSYISGGSEPEVITEIVAWDSNMTVVGTYSERSGESWNLRNGEMLVLESTTFNQISRRI